MKEIEIGSNLTAALITIAICAAIVGMCFPMADCAKRQAEIAAPVKIACAQSPNCIIGNTSRQGL